jgi:hypothetical protein
MGNLRLAQVPSEHHTKLFTNLVQLRGVESSKLLIQENALLAAAFPWCFSNEGHNFWQAIENGENPTANPKQGMTDQVQSLAAEAEARGFAVGVSTKFGEIRECNPKGEIYEHELCSDGSFFYHNIKVLSAKGKWCKPGKKENPEHKKEFIDARAIHAMLHEVFKIRSN